MSRCIFVLSVGAWLWWGGFSEAAEPGSSCLQQQIPRLLQEAKARSAAARPGFLMGQLVKRCPRLPLDIKLILYTHRLFPMSRRREGRKLFRDPGVVGALNASWDRMCPGFPTRLLARGSGYGPENMYLHIYKRCKGKVSSLLSQSELKSVVRSFVYGVRLFGGLLRAGVAEKDAKVFVRRGYLAEGTFPSWKLPTLRSPHVYKYIHELGFRSEALLFYRRRACSIKGGVVDASLKQGKKASSAIIVPLLGVLKAEVTKIKKIAAYNKAIKFTGHLSVFALPGISYKLMHEGFSTAYLAGYRTLFLMGKAPKPTPLSFVRMLPVQLQVAPKAAAQANATWVFRWRPKGIAVRLGGRAVAAGCGQWTKKPGQLTLAGDSHKALLQATKACIPKLKSLAPQARRVLLMPSGTMRYRSLARYLNALGFDPKGKWRLAPLALSVQTK